MGKRLLYLVFVIVLVSCGTKVSKNPESLIKEVELYSAKIDSDKALETDIIEGALTDTEGFEDIGKFKYTVFFNKETNELLKIKNLETTNKTITENYYFKNNKLSYFDSHSENSKPKKIFIYNGKVVSTESVSAEEQKLFIAKAKRFQKAFNETH
ncbi:hypothetical protein [Confluentibacter flavum]|uniref:Lipoprotein n=1 Tax=Confluentibacter flavum TaxID=1909700 RepID=A0A2N3HLX5_9FLAO|nr:hypothetical protein [Confluentibacter flavum]PKQ45848.1 hypothetical protein CSW08_05315 [Confluentibacter flavum]